jgi:hypothetical protein
MTETAKVVAITEQLAGLDEQIFKRWNYCNAVFPQVQTFMIMGFANTFLSQVKMKQRKFTDLDSLTLPAKLQKTGEENANKTHRRLGVDVKVKVVKTEQIGGLYQFTRGLFIAMLANLYTNYTKLTGQDMLSKNMGMDLLSYLDTLPEDDEFLKFVFDFFQTGDRLVGTPKRKDSKTLEIYKKELRNLASQLIVLVKNFYTGIKEEFPGIPFETSIHILQQADYSGALKPMQVEMIRARNKLKERLSEIISTELDLNSSEVNKLFE